MASQITHTLVEALPYIQKFSGKTVVIKFGGNAMVDRDLKNCFAKDIVFFHTLCVILIYALLPFY